jgi:hypothetical protein
MADSDRILEDLSAAPVRDLTEDEASSIKGGVTLSKSTSGINKTPIFQQGNKAGGNPGNKTGSGHKAGYDLGDAKAT